MEGLEAWWVGRKGLWCRGRGDWWGWADFVGTSEKAHDGSNVPTRRSLFRKGPLC